MRLVACSDVRCEGCAKCLLGCKKGPGLQVRDGDWGCCFGIRIVNYVLVCFLSEFRVSLANIAPCL
jgi:hypothetical protein